MIKSETACLTGHRPKGLPWGYDETKTSCQRFKKLLKEVLEGAISYGIKNFLTGMAEGFDMIATEILLNLREMHGGIKIIAIVPCLGQEKFWSEIQQERYKKILSQCDDKIILSVCYTQTCMNERNKFMIEHSSVCIACCNGKKSGTLNTIRFAKKAGCGVRVLNPDDEIK